MSANEAAAFRFTVQGDGGYRGADGHDGELAGMTLYVARALAQIDQVLGVGEVAGFRASGGPLELAAEIRHDGDFGLEVAGRLHRTDIEAPAHGEYALGATAGEELETVLDQVTQVALVAGCFIVSANGNLLADRVPGVAQDTLAGTGRRVKIAHDAFDRILGTTCLVTDFTWAQVVTAPVGNGLAVVIADPTCDSERIMSAVRASGAVLSEVDLATFRPPVPSE